MQRARAALARILHGRLRPAARLCCGAPCCLLSSKSLGLCAPPPLPRATQTQVRSSALGVSYAIAGAIAGGLAPLAAAALASATSNAAAPAFVSIAAAGLSAAACLALRAGWLG